MSLDKTSQPDRPGLDELVPSRYAVQVGEIDVLVVSDGVLPIPAPLRTCIWTTLAGCSPLRPAFRKAICDDHSMSHVFSST